jgi:6,7-dimethyl-8-ribityllumazine synthase
MAQTIIEGSFDAKGLRAAIVVSRFNSFITERLLDGALDALGRNGADLNNVQVIRVPGAWEMPIIASELTKQKQYDVVICLGAVIRGDTPHFDYVAGNAASGLANVSVETGVPISFGVLTTNTLEQAIDRAGAKSGNKGFDAAMTAIEMVNLIRNLRATAKSS